jgi:thiamine biosynthesis lipoprotein
MTSATEHRGTLHVEECMGTVFTIDVRDRGSWRDAIGEAVAWLHRVDDVFSTYVHDSDISRIRRGELAVADADPDVGRVLDLCAQVTTETGGYFTAFPDTGIDPTGLVKGWAIEQASRLLHHHGSVNHAVNGGGDIQIAGEAAPGRPWTIGISDPLDPTRVLATVTGEDFAIATSGTAERGAHITNPHTGTAARELASVTVIGRSLTHVDAYATAAFAMGPEALGWIRGVPGHDALLVFPNGRVASTPGFHRPAHPPKLVRSTGDRRSGTRRR